MVGVDALEHGKNVSFLTALEITAWIYTVKKLIIVGSGKIRMSNGARYIECYDAQGHRLERYLSN